MIQNLVSMMSVLITGGLGFIGINTVQELVSEDFQVVIVDRKKDPKILNEVLDSSQQKVKFFCCDILNLDCLNRVARDVEYILHLAAIVSVVEVNEKPSLAFRVNVDGTHNILLFSRINDNIEKVVFASSAAVYGNPLYVPIPENHPLKPISLYGLTKVLGEKLVRWYHEIYGLDYVILRYFNVYGPYMATSKYPNVILGFLMKAIKNEPLIIYGDGTQTRGFVYVKDVARANLLAIKKNTIGEFNVGTGIETTIAELANLIIRMLDSSSNIVFSEWREGDIKRSVADIKKITGSLGWKPVVSIESGLKYTIAWLKKCSFFHNFYNRAQ